MSNCNINIMQKLLFMHTRKKVIYIYSIKILYGKSKFINVTSCKTRFFNLMTVTPLKFLHSLPIIDKMYFSRTIFFSLIDSISPIITSNSKFKRIVYLGMNSDHCKWSSELADFSWFCSEVRSTPPPWSIDAAGIYEHVAATLVVAE